MVFNCLKGTESLRGDSLLFIAKYPGVTNTHLIYLGRMKCQYILTYFYKPFSALSLSRNFAQFSLKAVYVIMGIFWNLGVQITRKCICDSKNWK